MKQKIYLIFIVFITIITVFFIKSVNTNHNANVNKRIINNIITPTINSTVPFFHPPLDNINKRVTKKSFGIFISPNNSPIKNERFYGYHAGIDLEVFPQELNQNISVYAICSGKLLYKQYVSGYGGVFIQSCQLLNEPITIIYGHIRLSSIKKTVNQNIKAGEIIAVLGKNNSLETDGERMHLHLGFHKGTAINLKGYVNSIDELNNWIDPCIYLCKK